VGAVVELVFCGDQASGRTAGAAGATDAGAGRARAGPEEQEHKGQDQLRAKKRRE